MVSVADGDAYKDREHAEMLPCLAAPDQGLNPICCSRIEVEPLLERVIRLAPFSRAHTAARQRFPDQWNDGIIRRHAKERERVVGIGQFPLLGTQQETFARV